MRESLIKRHYEALRRGKLIAHKCRKCAALTFPITTACAGCGAPEWSEVELSGHGELLFASHNLAPPPHPRFSNIAPYVYGHIRLAEGLITQAILQGIEPEPDAMRALFERGPIPVKLDVLQMADLPVMSFRPVTS